MARRSIKHRAPDAARGHTELYHKRKKWGLVDRAFCKLEVVHQGILHRRCGIESQFGIGNSHLLRRHLSQYLDVLVKHHATPEDYQALFVIYVDVWMLKAVNFLIGHEGGNVYLSRIVETLEKGKTRKRIQKKTKWNMLYRDGGDEFVLIGVGNERISNQQLIEWKGDLTFEVRKIELCDLICFDRDDPKPEHLFAHLHGIDVPHDFVFAPEISIGFASAMLALAEYESERHTIYREALQKLVGKLLDLSDADSRENQEKKLRDLRARTTEGDLGAQTILALRARTSEERNLFGEKVRLLKEVGELRDRVEHLVQHSEEDEEHF